uniref:Uncharacterized protein n=1 Tax=Arundo donax TaxID=35708 RepID=A0A0A9EEN9_ARUDO
MYSFVCRDRWLCGRTRCRSCSSIGCNLSLLGCYLIFLNVRLNGLHGRLHGV